jgi:hypothetical protein
MNRTALTFGFSLLLVNSSSAFIPGVDEDLLRGDVNNDGRVDMADSVAIQAFLYQGGAAPTCMDAADVNDDGRVDNTDPICLMTYLFMGGSRPAAPFPACGPDPTADSVHCQHSNC